MADLTVTYLCPDALTDGVGASQVLSYVERMPARGVEVTLHSFEKRSPTTELVARLEAAGVTWRPEPFGRYGVVGGVGRMLRAARAARAGRGDRIVHARSDVSAAAAELARARPLVWDCRGLFSDQRVAEGSLRRGSPEDRVLGRIERRVARGSDAIITLTSEAVEILERRHGPGIAPKTNVITTCVDIGRFPLVPPMPADPLRVLLAGTLNRLYDVPAVVALVMALKRRRPLDLILRTPASTAWDDVLLPLASEHGSSTPAEMPGVIAKSHVGLSVWRDAAGEAQAGAMPTKIGEFLATGRPVVVNRRLSDAARLVEEHRCGVVLDASSDTGVERAADEVEALVADPEAAARCRGLAEAHFDLESGVDRLVDLYRRISR